MKRLALALAALAALLAAPGGTGTFFAPAAAQSPTIEVTNTGDAAGAGGAVCPHPTLCTLRRAIEVANDDGGTGEFVIGFAPAVFPPDGAESIAVGAIPLPNISRANVTIDARGAGVTLEGGSASLTTASSGLTATADRFSLFGMEIRSFSGSCVAATGEDARIGGPEPADRNLFGGCKTGVAAGGLRAQVQGNVIGFSRDGAANPVETGIVVAAGDALVGGLQPAGGANVIGFADIGVYVGSGSSQAFSGVRIEGNRIGRATSGEPAPVGSGIVLAQPSNASTVAGNSVAFAQTGVTVQADAGGISVVRNRLTSNTFEEIGLLAIDLAADGVRNANDDGDADTGPNGFLNHPVISRATQVRLTGTSCPGCSVQVYRARHVPGGQLDYGTTPLANGTVSADNQGNFAIDNPAAAPGDWLVAIVTDPDGNTSEFGPPSRVGAGAVLCGNVQLLRGWNHVGYFGPEPVALSNVFPPVPSGAVTAIFRLVDGTTSFEAWFAESAAGRTLHTVQPGEAYWFFAAEPVTLPGGFSLSFPLPVELEAGWNDFAYIGASAEAADALASVAPFRDLYRYDAQTARWLRHGDGSVPAWARDFATVEACVVYQVRLEAPATLVPLQP